MPPWNSNAGRNHSLTWQLRSTEKRAQMMSRLMADCAHPPTPKFPASFPAPKTKGTRQRITNNDIYQATLPAQNKNLQELSHHAYEGTENNSSSPSISPRLARNLVCPPFTHLMMFYLNIRQSSSQPYPSSH